MKRTNPLDSWKFAVPRLREAFGLFQCVNPIEELNARGPNGTGKTESTCAFMLACLMKMERLDGVKIPQWAGPVHGLALALDYPQQKLSTQQTALRLLGDWPNHPKWKGDDILSSLRIMPVDGTEDEDDWSILTFMSQENRKSGIGARADATWFSEPPPIRSLRELRKAPHNNRLGVRIIENTPIEIEQWWELAQDYGTVLEDEVLNRRTLRRIDQDRAEVRWSLDEVESWLMSPEKKDKLRRLYATDPFRDAREHGDYIDASGTCPFDVERLRAWLKRAA